MDNIWSIILTIVVSILSSGAVFTLITYLITRHDQRNDKFKTIEQKIDDVGKDVGQVSEDLKMHEAKQARTHILRFADELHDGKYHSDEYFRQQILDIDVYDTYCKSHPDFVNGLTKMSSEYIKKEYQKRYLKNEELTV